MDYGYLFTVLALCIVVIVNSVFKLTYYILLVVNGIAIVWRDSAIGHVVMKYVNMKFLTQNSSQHKYKVGRVVNVYSKNY